MLTVLSCCGILASIETDFSDELLVPSTLLSVLLGNELGLPTIAELFLGLEASGSWLIPIFFTPNISYKYFFPFSSFFIKKSPVYICSCSSYFIILP